MKIENRILMLYDLFIKRMKINWISNLFDSKRLNSIHQPNVEKITRFIYLICINFFVTSNCTDAKCGTPGAKCHFRRKQSQN